MKRIAALVAVLALTGCSTVQSKDIRTGGMTANLVVTLPEATDAADVSASLQVGNLTFVELGDGEKIRASGGGKDVKLKHHRAAGVTDYSNRLDGVVTAGTEITFDLERGGDNDSAPRSTVKLPERVHLVAPAAGTTLSRRRDIAVRFESEPSQLPSLLTWAGACIQEGDLELPPGQTSAVIARGSIKQVTTTPTPGQDISRCEVRLSLTRRTEGTLDPAFKNGSVTAESESARMITSAP
ncbi:hypothetical protein OHA18_42720 [Kribbella sp. NBC_00709]|uniref:hypothetical protein n=1 Tax=Kribbella sp. NBC_00709 TaxID=2975972 RepID=UPI002E28245C|nr:hypothetical protein [Kribbella sp. NBC_00709]